MAMDHEEYQYLRLVNELVYDAPFKGDRTGTGTFSVFTRSLRFKLNGGKTFPLLTTKTTHWKSIVHELLWFIAGDTNIKYLKDNGVRIWNEWADENGDLGPVYGKQWRDFGGVDQLADVIERIKVNPEDRRLIVSAWNPPEIPDMKLPPCHMIFQFYSIDGKLSLHMYQRSCDTFLGVPFNIASYALLLLMVAKVTGQVADELIWTGGDVHLYSNHVDQAKELLKRRPLPFPSVVINDHIKNIDDIRFDDISLQNYTHHDTIKAKVAV